MQDDKTVHSKSEEEEVTTQEVGTDVSDTPGAMIPKARLDKVIEQREEALRELSTVKEKLESLESLKDEVAELKNSVSKKNDDGEVFTREEEDALSKIDKGLKNKGYITQDQLDEMRRIDERNREINRLSDKYKKGSGFPEFKTDEVLVYANKKGFGGNLEAAYRDLHWEAITQVLSKGQETEVVESEKPTGGDRIKGTSVTTSQIANMDINEYSQNRDDIMGKFKKAIFGR